MHERTDTTHWWTDLLDTTRNELRHLRVAVYGGGGAPYHHAALAALWGAPPRALSGADIRDGALADVDVIVFPGGGARAMAGMLDPLGTAGAAAVRTWVAEGGMYVGSCAGSFLPAMVGDAYWRAHPEARELTMLCARLSNGSDSEWEGLTSPGVGVLDMEVTERNHWLVDGLPPRFRLVHYNGPMFLPVEPDGDDPLLGDARGVARFVARTDRFTPSETFMDASVDPTGGVFDSGVDAGASTAVTAPYGEGQVVLFGSHPEFGFDAIQLGWGEGVRLFANALRHQAARRSSDARRAPGSPAQGDGAVGRQALSALPARFERLAERFGELDRHADAPWLRPGCVSAFQGLAPAAVWRMALADAASANLATASYLRHLAETVDADGVAAATRWLDHPAPEGQDYGFMGLRQLADTIDAAIDTGVAAIDAGPGCLEHPYAGLDSHPYQLIASSYLSAAGLSACAALSATVAGAHAGVLDKVPVGPTNASIALAPTPSAATRPAQEVTR